MGYSIRTAEWRFTTWLPWNKVTLTSDWDGPHADELYTHVGDDSFEMDKYEIANEVADNPEAVAQLTAQIRAFFQAHEAKTAPMRLATVASSAAAVADTSDPYDV
jgi:hypothetical protein